MKTMEGAFYYRLRMEWRLSRRNGLAIRKNLLGRFCIIIHLFSNQLKEIPKNQNSRDFSMLILLAIFHRLWLIHRLEGYIYNIDKDCDDIFLDYYYLKNSNYLMIILCYATFNVIISFIIIII